MVISKTTLIIQIPFAITNVQPISGETVIVFF